MRSPQSRTVASNFAETVALAPAAETLLAINVMNAEGKLISANDLGVGSRSIQSAAHYN
jgi:hypothetical protein